MTRFCNDLPIRYGDGVKSTPSICPPGAATLYANTDAVEQAVTIVSVEIFQSVVAPGGQIEGVDFTPSPYRMGRSLQNRVIGLLGNYIDVSTMAM